MEEVVTRSLRERMDLVAVQALARAKEEREAHQDVVPVVFLLLPNNKIGLIFMQFANTAEKRAAYAKVVEVAREHHAEGVVMVNDGWVVKLAEGQDPLDQPAPSQHPKRYEALTIILQSTDGSIREISTHPYRYVKGKCVWDKVEVAEGLVNGLLGEDVEHGVN